MIDPERLAKQTLQLQAEFHAGMVVMMLDVTRCKSKNSRIYSNRECYHKNLLRVLRDRPDAVGHFRMIGLWVTRKRGSGFAEQSKVVAMIVG